MTLQKTIEEINRNKELITISPAVVSVKRLGAASPEYVQIGPVIDGVHIGFRSDVEQFCDDGTTGPIGAVVYGESVTLRFTLAQAGIFNLATALNYNDEDYIGITQPVENPPADGVVAFQPGGKRDVEEYEIKVQIRLASGKKIREYIFFKAVPEPDFAHAYTRDERTVYECEFSLLMDQSKPDGKRYFSVTDYFDSEHGEIGAPGY
jgi:hypothetical protein